MAGKKQPKNNSILIDADAFVAVAREDDSNHEQALRILSQLLDQSVHFITSNYVFAESVTVISQRVGHKEALAFANNLKSPKSFFLIERISEEVEDLALGIFSKQTSKNVSFVDCTNMALVDSLDIGYIFSFDKVYRKNGYKLAEMLCKQKL